MNVYDLGGIDYVIAENKDEVWELLPYFHDDKDIITPRKCDNDEEFSIWLDERGNVTAHFEGKLVTKTMKEWIEKFGKGYLATTEF